MHRRTRRVLARLAIGENLTSRGGGGTNLTTNRQHSGGVKPNGNPIRAPANAGAAVPYRILEAGKLRESDSEMLGYREPFREGGEHRERYSGNCTHGYGNNPSQSPVIWAERYTQPRWSWRVGV